MPLAPVFSLPINIGAGPGEQLFVRWSPDRR